MMTQRFRTPFRITTLLVFLMAAQSVLGLMFRDAYLDAPWIKAAWFGNDLITLILAVPLTIAALVLTRRGSVRGLLFWIGMLGYAVYNYAYYMLGVELNVFFPLYVAALLAAAISLLLLLVRLDASALAGQVGPALPRRTIGGYFVFVAAGLTVVWLGMWGAHVFRGAELPVEKSAFQLVASLDLAIMVPLLSAAGILLWKRRPWGIVLTALAGVQSSLYLLVLTTNSAVAVMKGVVQPPGEVPVWGALCVLTAAATVVVFSKAGGVRGRPNQAGAGLRQD